MIYIKSFEATQYGACAVDSDIATKCAKPRLNRRLPHIFALSSVIAVCCTLLGCTMTLPSSSAQPTAYREFPMTALSTPMTAEDIGRRVLKLIDSLKSAKDLAPEHIEQQTGIKVEFKADDHNKYGFGGALTDEWFYNLVSTPETPGEKPTSLLFSFDDQTHSNADTAPICSPDFNSYSKALTAAGFSSKPMRGRKGINAWYFTRGDIGILAYTHGNRDPGEGQVCLSKLVISAYA